MPIKTPLQIIKIIQILIIKCFINIQHQILIMSRKNIILNLQKRVQLIKLKVILNLITINTILHLFIITIRIVIKIFTVNINRIRTNPQVQLI